MDYISVKDASIKWGVHIRIVQEYCKGGRIKGAKKIGASWAIPYNAQKPCDPRRFKSKNNSEFDLPRKSPFLSMTDLYNTPGTADGVLASFSDNPLASALFSAQLSYLRGDFESAYESAVKIPETTNCFDARIGRGIMMSLYAMYRGSIPLWEKSKKYIAGTPYKNSAQRDVLMFWLAAADSSIYNNAGFPTEFRRGCFDFLPADSYGVARFFYSKYLYVEFNEDVLKSNLNKSKKQHSNFLQLMPCVCELLISQTKVERNIVTEIYLNLMCAIAYHNKGENNLAVKHINDAISLALPDRLLSPFAEYRRPLDFLVDECLNAIDRKAMLEVKKISTDLNKGWVTLHNFILNRNVSNDLSIREREIAKLAVFGMTNREISERLHISIDTVKQNISSAIIKTGVKKRSELVKFI